MVARGDLGIELPIAKVPAVQKRLIELAGQALEAGRSPRPRCSPRWSPAPRPTRAEVTDVANAIYDGTDAVMLSEETAIGEHPVEAVRVMDRIARETEPDLPYGDWLCNRVETDAATSPTRSLRARSARPTASASRRSSSPTRSGRTARLVSALRPKVPILAIYAADRDRAPAQPPLRGQLRARRGLGEPARRCSTSCALDRPREGRRQVRRPDRRSPPACPSRSSARTCSRSTGCRRLSQAERNGFFWFSLRRWLGMGDVRRRDDVPHRLAQRHLGGWAGSSTTTSWSSADRARSSATSRLWGWVHLVLGSILALTGRRADRWATRKRACSPSSSLTINAIAQVVWFPAAPLWAFLIILLDVFNHLPADRALGRPGVLELRGELKC